MKLRIFANLNRNKNWEKKTNLWNNIWAAAIWYMLCRRRSFLLFILPLCSSQFFLPSCILKMSLYANYTLISVVQWFFCCCCKADFSYSRCLIRSEPPHFLSRFHKERASQMHAYQPTKFLYVLRLFNQKIYGSLFCWPIYANQTCICNVYTYLYWLCMEERKEKMNFTESNCIR